MARFDGKLVAAAEVNLDLGELMSAFSSAAAAGLGDRTAAMACLLSASEGWRDARNSLKGNFSGLAQPTWLTPGKE